MDRSAMDRIKLALHVAGQERNAGIAAEAVTDDSAPPSVELTTFEYTATRVVDVPASTFASMRIMTGRGQDPVTRAYKLLRTRVLQKLVKEGWQTVAVVSPSAGDGKTLTAINLGIGIGNTKSHTALLVDLDWQQPSVHGYFRHRPEHDICDYLRGERPLAEVLVNPGLPRFCFLPCAQPVADSSEHLASLAAFVRELKGRYRNRIVLFDMPPLLATDDALSFLPFVDCALLVVQEGKTRAEDVARSLELIRAERLLGSVINKSSQTLPAY
jgi:Mrp family chromosome partitioning ATPase